MKDDRYKDFLDDLYLSYSNETFTAPYDTEVLWFEENQSLFIRGTDSLTDWLFNFMIWPNAWGFHYGYYLKAKALCAKLDEEGIIPTTVVGHSAGGAIAQCVGFEYDCEAYSLASPKTTTKTNSNFNDWADQKLVLIIQDTDIVSKMPPFLLHHPNDPMVLDGNDYAAFSHHLISFE